MSWNVPRGRYRADALELQEIQKLQAAPESASHHIAQSCNACRCAARERRATLEPILRDLLHVPPAHGVLSLEVRTPDGQVHRRVAPNAWPKAGEAYLVNAWRGLMPLSDARYHALGTSTAAFAENQTQCQAELTNQYLVDNVRATGTL